MKAGVNAVVGLSVMALVLGYGTVAGRAHDASGEQARGNWFAKRGMVQDSFKVVQAITQELQDIERSDDVTQAQEGVHTAIQAIWHELGGTAQEVTARLERHRQALQENLERHTTATPEPNVVHQEVARIKDQQGALEQVHNTIALVDQFMQGADHAITVADQQRSTAREYEQQAFAVYEEMVAALDDEHVRVLAGHVNAYAHNMQAIARYVHGDMPAYLQLLTEQLHQVGADIHTQVTHLRDLGVDLLQEPVAPEPLPEPTETRPVTEPTRWWQRIVQTLGRWWSAARSWWA